LFNTFGGGPEWREGERSFRSVPFFKHFFGFFFVQKKCIQAKIQNKTEQAITKKKKKNGKKGQW